MSTVRFDDGDPNIFTNGFWDQLNFGSEAYQGTVSWTNTAGNSKVIRFIGTSITVRGGLQPIKGTSNQPLTLQFIIDGGQPFTYQPADAPDFQYASYYQSPQLPLGEHVLTMVNMVSGDICLLDSFTIQANGGTAQLLRSDGSASPRKSPPLNPSTTTPNAPSPSTPAQGSPTSPGLVTVTNTLQLSASSTPTTPASISPSSNSINGAKPSSQSSSSNASSLFSASLYQPTTINANGEQPKGSSSQTPMIIAVATSVLLLLVVIGISFFFLRRRRKRRRDIIEETPHTLSVDPFPPHNINSGDAQALSPSPEKCLISSNNSYEPYRNSAMTSSATSTISISGHQPELYINEKRYLNSNGTSQCPTSAIVNNEALLPPYAA